METILRDCLWKHFSASIDMLKNIVAACPDTLWNGKIYYMTYHTTIFLDYYLTQPVKDFEPRLAYKIVSPDEIPAEGIDDVMPERFYSREEIIVALEAIKIKCRELILSTPAEKFGARWIHNEEIALHDLCPGLVENYNLLEILCYNLRHLQHHIGQLNQLLRQDADIAVDWI